MRGMVKYLRSDYWTRTTLFSHKTVAGRWACHPGEEGTGDVLEFENLQTLAIRENSFCGRQTPWNYNLRKSCLHLFPWAAFPRVGSPPGSLALHLKWEHHLCVCMWGNDWAIVFSNDSQPGDSSRSFCNLTRLPSPEWGLTEGEASRL